MVKNQAQEGRYGREALEGAGEIEEADGEEANYEGYAPHGIAVFVESLTDNTNRTVARAIWPAHSSHLSDDRPPGNAGPTIISRRQPL